MRFLWVGGVQLDIVPAEELRSFPQFFEGLEVEQDRLTKAILSLR